MARREDAGADAVIKIKEGDAAIYTYHEGVSRKVYNHVVVDRDYR